ncbi:MAG: GTPase domain-containing protein, partial [Thermoguttaceae bacterium]
MTGVQLLWNKIWQKVLAPEVDPRTLDDRLRAVKSALPPPVIWLLGKAQSGKTSLVHAMTGSSRAEIGGGFRPCTRVAQMYSFPNENECLLRFLDTRGLGEAGQDALAEIPKLEAEADLIIVVVKAMDHAQQHVLDILRGVAARHSDWPILVLQTALHEGYPAGQMRHMVPYPFAEPPYRPEVPHDLARSLMEQRDLFHDYRARFVPVDLTLPEDGFEPVDYGLERLWTVIEELLPLGLRGMLGQTPESRQAIRDELFRKAYPCIVAYAMAAGGAGAVPLPAVDVPLVLTAQAKMLHKIAENYQQPMDLAR